MSRVILVLILLVSYGSNAMSGKEYLKKVHENYDELNSMELLLEYNLFKGASSNVLRDSYTGIVCKSGNNSYRKVYNEEVITTPEMSLVVNHDLRTIQIAAAIKQTYLDEGLEKSIGHCSRILVQEIEKGKLITMEFKEGSSMPYSKAEVIIDKKFWIQKVTLYYTTQMNFSGKYLQPEWGYPRLEIVYKNLNKKWSDKEEKMSTSKYLTKVKGEYTTTELYSSYRILR